MVTCSSRIGTGESDDSSRVVGQDKERCGAWDKEVTWDKDVTRDKEVTWDNEVAASARTAPSLSVSSRLSAASAVTLPCSSGESSQNSRGWRKKQTTAES